MKGADPMERKKQREKQGGSNKIYPRAKKEMKLFLSSEEGRITRKAIIKTAMATAFIGMMVDASMVQAVHANSQSYLHYSCAPDGTNCNAAHSSHSSHGSHGSHGSHASHASHGSHGSW